MKKLSKKEVLQKLALLPELDEQQQKELVCTLIGHSNIQDICFGYVSCARCGQQVGDSLAGVYDNPDQVVVGHRCEICVENYKKCTWRDKLMTPDPFAETELEKAIKEII